jgi:hypothetical protein
MRELASERMLRSYLSDYKAQDLGQRVAILSLIALTLMFAFGMISNFVLQKESVASQAEMSESLKAIIALKQDVEELKFEKKKGKK